MCIRDRCITGKIISENGGVDRDNIELNFRDSPAMPKQFNHCSHLKGRGNVGSRFLCLCDRSELENGRADGAGTDFDYVVLITRNVWQSLAYIARSAP